MFSATHDADLAADHHDHAELNIVEDDIRE
jgi:hypothetical protein